MKVFLLSLALAVLSAITCPAAVVMTAPVRYRSVLDSPYLDQHLASTAVLQTFEDLDDECCENLILDRQGGELVNSPNPSGGGGGEYLSRWR